jgi:hypothetical protein
MIFFTLVPLIVNRIALILMPKLTEARAIISSDIRNGFVSIYP